MDFTPVKITRTRRNELEQAWLELQVREGKRLDLQEVVDFVLATGLQALGVHANSATPAAPIISQSPALVNEQS